MLLATYLSGLGFSPFRVGAVVTATLVGSAALTLSTGLSAARLPVRSLLLAASALMLATGVGFAAFTTFWPIVLIAVVGTLNPSGGDVSVFLPTEQSLLAGEVDDDERPQLYAVYNLAGAFAAAFGALCSALPEVVARATDWTLVDAQRLGFGVYALVALTVAGIYRGLDRPEARTGGDVERRRPLERSRRTVLELAALFSLDSAGGGFVVQSLLVLWLHLRYDLSAAATASVFFATSLLGATSQLLAAPLARRIGLVRTMAFTHIPANLLLISAALVTTAPLAVGLLLVRAVLSNMDVPARQAFVMAVVPPEERPAAASVTNVPRSLAAATTPLLAGALLAQTSFGWPLIIGGTIKVVYDLLLLRLYREVPPEAGARRVTKAARPTT